VCGARVVGVGREARARGAADVRRPVRPRRAIDAASPAGPSRQGPTRRRPVHRRRTATRQIFPPQLLNPLPQLQGTVFCELSAASKLFDLFTICVRPLFFTINLLYY